MADLDDETIEALLDLDGFVRSCDEAFRLYGSGEMVNAPREESVETSGGEEVFRLTLAGRWAGKLEGRKVIVERSDVATGHLGERTAVLEVTLAESGEQYTLDAEVITNRRTGAAAALGARYLASPDSRTVGIVGTGRVSRNAAVAIDRLVAPGAIKVTSRRAENRDAFVAEVGPLVSADLAAVPDIETAVGDADIVVTAVPTPEPILHGGMLKPGAHLSVVAGDPRTVQLDRDILTTRGVVTDHPDQARSSGDFARHGDRGVRFLEVDGHEATIGDAALGRLESYRGTGCVAYFTGMAVQDLHAAYTVLQSEAGIQIAGGDVTE